jgi:hypothetical protein
MNTSRNYTMLAALLCGVLCLHSCITTITEPLDLAHSEKLVVRGILRAGETIDNISITTSLPALADLTDSAIAVKDAQGTLTVSGMAYPLRLQGASLQGASVYGIPTLRAVSGTTYTLRIQRGTKTVQAETQIPPKPQVQSVRIIPQLILSATSATPIPGAEPVITFRTDTTFAAEVDVQALPRTVYRVAIQVIDSVRGVELTQLYDGTSLFHTEATPIARTLTSGALPLQTRGLLRSVSARFRVVVYAYSEAYYAYLLTRSRGQQASNILGGANDNVSWNVQGDGIGLFIGVAETSFLVQK